MYKIPELLKFPKIQHAFSTKADGNMDFRFGSRRKVLANRKRFLSQLGISLENCVFLKVTQNDGVVKVDEHSRGLGSYTSESALAHDAIYTNSCDVFLVLLIADCAPIILYDKTNNFVALLHVGWRGADINIISKTISILKKEYKTKIENLIVGIGPSARKDSYVKENPQQVNDPRWTPYLKCIESGKYKVDFVGFAVHQLIQSGVQEENIYDCYIDTVRDGRFFSAVGDNDLSETEQGRFACVVGLKSFWN